MTHAIDMKYVIPTYRPCAPSIDVMWKNLCLLNQYKGNANNFKCIIAGGYFSLKKNRTKTLRHFEIELKKNNINMSIIADEIDKDTQDAINKKDIIIIKSQYVYLYQNEHFYNMTNQEFINNVNPNHIAKYSARYCFDYNSKTTQTNEKTRQERVIHNENLKKLIDSGFPFAISNITTNLDSYLINDLNNNLNHNLNNNYNYNYKKRKVSTFDNYYGYDYENYNNYYTKRHNIDLFDKLMKTEVLIELTPINLEKVFYDAWNLHSLYGARMKITDINKNGPIRSITKDGKILCDVGAQNHYDCNGNSYIKYILLSTLAHD